MNKNNAQTFCTHPSVPLKKVKERITLVPSFASLDKEGYAEVWLNSKNDWLVKHLHLMVESKTELAKRFDNETGARKRMLD